MIMIRSKHTDANTLMLAMSVLAITSQTSAFSSGAAATRRMMLANNAPTTPSVGVCTSLSAVREATFGMGCFWEPSESLLKQPGILDTTVGYTGAPKNKPPPQYDNVCFGNDWVEAVRVAYDDEVVSYDQLLDYFFQFQKPGYSRQYASIVFANDAAEEKEAARWKKENVANSMSYNTVEIEPSSSFYKAESYHQRYWEKKRFSIAIGIALIAGESGAYNDFLSGVLGTDELFGQTLETIFGALFLAGAGWTLLERLVVRDVKELKQGDFINMALQENN